MSLRVEFSVDAAITFPKLKTLADPAPIETARMGNGGLIVLGPELIMTPEVVAVVQKNHTVF